MKLLQQAAHIRDYVRCLTLRYIEIDASAFQWVFGALDHIQEADISNFKFMEDETGNWSHTLLETLLAKSSLREIRLGTGYVRNPSDAEMPVVQVSQILENRLEAISVRRLSPSVEVALWRMLATFKQNGGQPLLHLQAPFFFHGRDPSIYEIPKRTLAFQNAMGSIGHSLQSITLSWEIWGTGESARKLQSVLSLSMLSDILFTPNNLRGCISLRHLKFESVCSTWIATTYSK